MRGALVLAALVGGAGCGDDTAARQEEVAARGAEVMPFDLDATTHRFTPTESGGVQHVVADAPSDTEQVRSVRTHLREEADRFAAGDFGAPASIHGDDMPGLAELAAAGDALDVAYEDTPGGGRITYRSADPALVDAVHRWFAAQADDHGEHAEHAGPGGHAGH